MNPTLLFWFFWLGFLALDTFLYFKASDAVPSWKEWASNGWWRLIPGSGFYLWPKYARFVK